MSRLKSLFSLRPVAEIGLIIVGVLLALAVDAWWDEMQDAALEAQVMRSLLSELAIVSKTTSTLIERNSLMIEQARRIAEDPGALDSDVQLDLGILFASVPYDLRLRTYDELNSSGRFHILSDRELRLLLVDFDAKAEVLVGYEQQMQIQWNRTARPVLYRTTSFKELGTPHVVLPNLSDLGKQELLNVIVDRGNFTMVHRRMIQEFLSIISKLENRIASILPD